MRATVIPVLALSALLCLSADAKAAPLVLTFHEISTTDTTPQSTVDLFEDIAEQLTVEIYSSTEAKALGLAAGVADIQNMASTDVLFLVKNTSVRRSSISEVYFDDGTILGLSKVINSLGVDDFTAFAHLPKNGGGNSPEGADPANLPGGKDITPKFEATEAYSVDAVGNPVDGVNTSADILGIVFTTKSLTTPLPGGTPAGFQGIVDTLTSGALRVGLHVRDIGADGLLSAAFVNDPPDDPLGGPVVPEPATLVLLGMGGIGFLGHRLLRLKRGSAA